MKIKKWFRQVFRGWVPTEPLTTKHWLRNRIRLLGLSVIAASLITIGVLSLFASPLTAIPPPIFTGEYNPGVSVGDYVVYGNFVCNKEHRGKYLCINDLAFKKIEVVEVSGKEVTFLYTEQLKNGSATWRDGLTSTWNVEKADFSDDVDYALYSLDWDQIVAANLTDGFCRVSGCDNPDCDGVETQVRTYLGVDRNVVICSRRQTEDEGLYGRKFHIMLNEIYDQLSGIRLEVERLAWDGESYKDLYQGFSVVETNIFSAPNGSLSLFSEIMVETPTVILYAITGSIIIAVFVAVGVILRKRRFRGGEKDAEE